MGKEEAARIQQTLRDASIYFEHFIHEPVYTSEQAARVRKSPLHNGVKAMVLETERGLVIALLAADLKIDLKKFAETLKFKKVQLAKKELVLEKTNCEVGSVPPFGFPSPLPTYIDESVFDHEEADFNIGLLTESVRVTTEDLRKILPQKLLRFAQTKQ